MSPQAEECPRHCLYSGLMADYRALSVSADCRHYHRGVYCQSASPVLISAKYFARRSPHTPGSGSHRKYVVWAITLAGIRDKLKSIFQMFCSICESCSQAGAELTNNSRNNFTQPERRSSLFLESHRIFYRGWGVGPVSGETSRKPRSALGLSNIQPLLPRWEMFTASFQIDFSCLQ